MALTKYVSAEWVETIPGGTRSIKAIGDDGLEYWLPGDDPAKYDVPPWQDFARSAAGKSFLKTTPTGKPAPEEPEPPEAA